MDAALTRAVAVVISQMGSKRRGGTLSKKTIAANIANKIQAELAIINAI
jgi:hypothetical protein